MIKIEFVTLGYERDISGASDKLRLKENTRPCKKELACVVNVFIYSVQLYIRKEINHIKVDILTMPYD